MQFHGVSVKDKKTLNENKVQDINCAGEADENDVQNEEINSLLDGMHEGMKEILDRKYDQKTQVSLKQQD